MYGRSSVEPFPQSFLCLSPADRIHAAHQLSKADYKQYSNYVLEGLDLKIDNFFIFRISERKLQAASAQRILQQGGDSRWVIKSFPLVACM